VVLFFDLWVVFRAGIDVFLSAKAEIAVERGHGVAFLVVCRAAKIS
jgi:hypothetical protein